MGFDELPPIETVQTYLDTAFKRAKDNSRKYTLKDNEKSKRGLVLAQIKITTASDTLQAKLKDIIDKYPNFDNLSTFYEELLRSTVNFDDLKQALGAVNWCRRQLLAITRATLRAKHTDEGAFYGRVSSLFKQIAPQLKIIHNARGKIRTFPSIKDNLATVCIAGFPNVGKSTLLAKLTPARPEINDYAFTTKTLNLGYKIYNGVKVQFIDTPGTLNRDRMNNVELQAHLALRYCADVIIYVFDLSAASYKLEDQLALYTAMNEYDKELKIYFSKQDVIPKEQVAAFIKEHQLKDVLADVEAIQEYAGRMTRKRI